MENYIVLAIPFFFLLIGIEVLISKLRKTDYYRFNDAITNLSCGIGQQVTGVLLKTVFLIGYIAIYEHFRFLDVPVTLWTGLLLFIGVDFFYYWFHRYAHEISVLWGSHIVHHQSEEYNLTVALRQAWLQGAFSWMFYLPLAFIGFDPVFFLAINAFQTLYQFWIHTKAIDKLPAPIEYVFNTPSHHRVHHGVNPKYIDRNHGGTLIIWDRMFGTFQKEEEEVVYGITSQTNSWNPLWVNFQYWIDLGRAAGKAQRWRDKWNIFFKQPGWMPEELGGVQKPKEVTKEQFKKYDTQIPISLNYYVLVQYVVILVGATVFLYFQEQFGWALKLSLAGVIIFSIVSLGGILERKSWAFPVELLRILLIAVIPVALFYPEEMALYYLLAASAVYMAGSAFWIIGYREIFQNTLPSTQTVNELS